MRPDLVFSDSSVSPSFFLTVPARKPRTECGCHPVIFEMAAMVVPFLARSRSRTRSCLVLPPLARATGGALLLVFDLSCFVGLVRGLGRVLDLAIRTSEVGDIIVAPPRPRSGKADQGVSLRQTWASGDPVGHTVRPS